ncbi:g2937 [Coccomyxa viridis]|uniref:G2937 protein n=1 Tax=Coccomyxa viridis TaxID=1274662 RepID=A0ABP1FLL0_9CHLO
MVLVCERAAPSLAASRSARQCTAQQSLCFRQNVACNPLARLNRRGLLHSRAVNAGRGCFAVRAGDWNPPTVADTKKRFYETFRKPIPGLYNNVIQELLVQQHIMRYNKKYQYDEVFALGFVSVFDQVLEGLPDGDRENLFNAYISCLDEDASKYRQDAERLEGMAKGLSSPADLKPAAEGTELQSLLGNIADRAKGGTDFLYTKFFAIGLFRLLELTGGKDPKALESLVSAMSVNGESVNRDLMTYKGVLSKLSAAKDMMKEMLERERRKRAERDAEKKDAASKAVEPAENVVTS